MITKNMTTVVDRHQLQQAIRTGLGAGISFGLIAILALTLFPSIIQLSPNPDFTAFLNSLPWAGGVTLFVGSVWGLVHWLRFRHTVPLTAENIVTLPGTIAIAINGTTTVNPKENWAVYVDVANVALHEGNGNNLSSGELEQVLEWIEAAHPHVLIRQAYGDFSSGMADLGMSLRRNGFTLTHLPHLSRRSEKNHSDIQMVVDALYLARLRPDIGGFIVLSGDSDYTPLLIQLRELGKETLVIGRQSTTSSLLISQADRFAYIDSIAGRNRLSPNALRNTQLTIRNAITALASQGIAVPASTFRDLLKLLGIDVTALGFRDLFTFQKVMTDLDVIRRVSTPNGDAVVVGNNAPGDDQLSKLLRAIQTTVVEFQQRRKEVTLSEVLEAIWKADPSLDITKTTGLVMIQIGDIANRLNLVTVERRPSGNRLLPGKQMDSQ